MHLDTEMVCTQRCNCKPESSDCGDIFGDLYRVNLELHMEVGIKRVWRCIWRLTLTELTDAL